MNKIVLGLLLGGFLGIFDGLTAWFTPEVRSQLLGIVIGSTFKGLITGVLIGYFAKKVNSLPLGVIFGLAVGLILASWQPCRIRPANTIISKSCCRAAFWG
jgi:hypothetical protein